MVVAVKHEKCLNANYNSWGRAWEDYLGGLQYMMTLADQALLIKAFENMLDSQG